MIGNNKSYLQPSKYRQEDTEYMQKQMHLNDQRKANEVHARLL